MQSSGQTRKPTILEIITIGREILDGRVIDTNSVWLAEKLKERGLVPRYAQKVDDDFERVIEAFEIAQKRSQIVLVTGGLGPTSDDLTVEAFSRFTHEPLELNSAALTQVEGWFKRMNRTMNEVQRKQAFFPKSCKILENFEGTAPGFSRKFDTGQVWYFFPGVPKEMKRMVEMHVFPELPRVEGYRTSSWATQFTSEGELQKRLTEIYKKLPGEFEISYRTRFPENHIGLHGVCQTSAAMKSYKEIALQIERTLGDDVFSGGMDSELRSLETEVVEKLKTHQRTIGTVESCTGGLVANRITDVSGSSAVFWASWLTYDNRAKEMLGVPSEFFEKHGAVSQEVALSLAEAGLKKMNELGTPNPICVSTSGIAGPDGGTPTKPVGLCYVAIAQNGVENQTETEVLEVRGMSHLKRAELKLLFSQRALDLVRRSIGKTD